MSPILEFLALWAALYLANVGVYFVVGWALLQVSARLPARRIPAINGRDRRVRMNARTEMILSMKALATVDFCLAAGLYAQHLGWALTPLELTPVSFLWTLALALVLNDAWFYVEHRLMHTKLFYRRFHQRHHQSVAPTVWTADAISVVECIFIHVFLILLPFILPAPALVLIALRLWDEVRGLIGHAGYEHLAGPLARAPWPFISAMHHDLHHQRFTVNFANQFSVWDRLFGTLDRDYDSLVREVEAGGRPADLVRRTK